MDRVPRRLSHQQMEALRILSRQVVAQVILGKNLHDLKNALQARDNLERDLQKLVKDFQEARTMIGSLKGLIPVCAQCKKVRNDRGYWEQVEAILPTRPAPARPTAFVRNASGNRLAGRARRMKTLTEGPMGLRPGHPLLMLLT